MFKISRAAVVTFFIPLPRCFPLIANPRWEIVNVVNKIRDCYMFVSLDFIQCSIAELWD